VPTGTVAGGATTTATYFNPTDFDYDRSAGIWKKKLITFEADRFDDNRSQYVWHPFERRDGPARRESGRHLVDAGPPPRQAVTLAPSVWRRSPDICKQRSRKARLRATRGAGSRRAGVAAGTKARAAVADRDECRA